MIFCRYGTCRIRRRGPVRSLLNGGSLKVDVIGRHFEITPSVEEYAMAKTAKLDRFFDRLGDVRVTLSTMGQDLRAEIKVLATKGVQIVGEARGETIYAAIDLAVDKVERQVTRHKEKLSDHRTGRPSRE